MLKFKLPKIKKTHITAFSATLLFLMSFPFYFFLSFHQRVYLNVFVANVNLSGLTKDEVVQKLSATITKPEKIFVTHNKEEGVVSLSDALSYDFDKTAEEAFLVGRKKNLFVNSKDIYSSAINTKTIPLSYDLNLKRVEEEIGNFAKKFEKSAVLPSVKKANKSVVFEKGSAGIIVDYEMFFIDLDSFLKQAKRPHILLSTKFIDVSLSQKQENIYTKRAKKLLGKSIYLKMGKNIYDVDDTTLLSFLLPQGNYNNKSLKTFAQEFSSKNEKTAQNPVFIFTNERVTEFSAGNNGIEINEEKLVEQIKVALAEIEKKETQEYEVEVPMQISAPDYSLNTINSLGIHELLGSGTSRYTGSIASRIHNISVASSRFTGVLVAPEETFSFNKTLGEVSKETGYREAYVIKDGATVLGDGGGVCQVSTTLFRAVLNASLPINERQAHSYRVSYYEQGSPPGIDATVYEPSPDFKFTNNTPAHILIQATTNPSARTLVFDIYGTSDNRVSTITKPVVTNITPPPEDLYIDDPTLPTGEIKQIDWKAWGAKVYFTYTVTRDSEKIFEKTYFSNYRPWQAKFLRGTSPVN